MTDSQTLLAEYTRNGSESAFRELVTRYLGLVYSTALRLVDGDTHLAEDVAQTVFMDLSRNARNLSSEVMLGGWLHQRTFNVATPMMRAARRRQSREREAVQMNAMSDHSSANYEQIAPMLDEALTKLGKDDRAAILLRFFEQQEFRTVGQALGVNEDAARMRVTRALEKLEALLKHRGITTSASALAVVLAANAIQAAPVGLAVTISTAAALGGTSVATTTTATVVKTIAMTTLQKTIIGATLAAAVGTGIYEARQASRLREQNQTLQQQQTPLAEENRQLNQAFSETTNQVAVLREDNERLSRNTAELASLRGELVRLKQENANLRKFFPALPSFVPGNTNGVAEGDYTSQDISVPKNAVAHSPGQAAGTPDTRPGNLTTAWTPHEANAGPEWLQLEYAKAVDIQALRVYEEANSGAITKVTAVLPDGTETVISHTHQEPRTRNQTGVYMFGFNASVATAACVRIYFDTTLAPGRIAVDTVDLRGRDGSKQWPARVRASSYYEGGTLPRSP